MNTITVIGSINLDRTIRVKQMPKPGETMHTKEIFSAGGGRVQIKQWQQNVLKPLQILLGQSAMMRLAK